MYKLISLYYLYIMYKVIDNNIILLTVIIVILICFLNSNYNPLFIEPYNVEHMTTTYDKKADAITQLMTIEKDNMTEANANNLYDKLFVNQADLNEPIFKIFESLDYVKHNNYPINDNPYYHKTYIALCNIINKMGTDNGLQWTGNNVLTPLNLSIMKKSRLQEINNFDKNKPVDSTAKFLLHFSKFQFYDFMDTIRFNNLNSPMYLIIYRHPILNANKNAITDLIVKMYPNFKNNIDDLLKLSKKEFNIQYPIERIFIENNLVLTPDNLDRTSIINSMINVLFTTYENDLLISELLQRQYFGIKTDDIFMNLAIYLNQMTLYITPNINYFEDTAYSNLKNSNIGDLNRILLNIQYYKDIDFLNSNLYDEQKQSDSTVQMLMNKTKIVELVNILYGNIDKISDETFNNFKIAQLYEISEPDMQYMRNNIGNVIFDGILTSNAKYIDCQHIQILIKQLHIMISRNHPHTPSEYIKNVVNRYAKIKDITTIIIFG